MRPVSRRSVLGLAVLAAAGCHKAARRPAATPPTADRAALASAASQEQGLITTYEAAISKAAAREIPALQVALAVHRTHLAALREYADSTPATGTSAPIRNLPAALQLSAVSLRALAINATSGANAALLASIAASHEVSAGD